MPVIFILSVSDFIEVRSQKLTQSILIIGFKKLCEKKYVNWEFCHSMFLYFYTYFGHIFIKYSSPNFLTWLQGVLAKLIWSC